MLLTGTEYICIVAASDTSFASPVWLEEILTEGEYSKPTDGPQLWDDQYFNTVKKHSLKVVVGDTDQFLQLETWDLANTPLFIYLFGIDGSVIWEDSATIRTSRKRVFKFGNVDGLEIQAKKTGANLNIITRKNLLSTEIANGATLTGITIESGLTFTSTSKNGSFTLGSSPVYKITKTATDGLIYHKAEVNKRFPIKAGMVVQVAFDTYAGANNSDGNPGIRLTGYNGSDVSTETFLVGNGAFIMGRLTGTYMFTSASTRYFKLSIVADETNSVNEFDNIVLAYGWAGLPKFIDF
ncbi:MAG: hypothetical protein LCH54_15510 [Bacteroidetes bacterium]|nr:hypothetical protein [Bacteroidota bacterium]